MKVRVYVTEEVTYEPIELEAPDDLDEEGLIAWIDEAVVDHLDPTQQSVSERTFEFEEVN